MQYDVLTWEPDPAETRPWEVALTAYLNTQVAAGWQLVTMAERLVEVAQIGGMGGTTHEERVMVLVFGKEGP
jgi:hypothetical protein